MAAQEVKRNASKAQFTGEEACFLELETRKMGAAATGAWTPIQSKVFGRRSVFLPGKRIQHPIANRVTSTCQAPVIMDCGPAHVRQSATD